MKRVLAGLLILVLLASGCAYAAVTGQEEAAYLLYFREADLANAPGGDALRAETVYLDEEEQQGVAQVAQALMEELTVEYVKVGPLQIPESVVISWVIMVLVVLGSILLTRNLKVDHISKRQAVLEMAYTAGKNFFEGLLGKEGACYVPYLMTVAIYIACSNLIGVFGVKPPTKDLNVTAALALMSLSLIHI